MITWHLVQYEWSYFPYRSGPLIAGPSFKGWPSRHVGTSWEKIIITQNYQRITILDSILSKSASSGSAARAIHAARKVKTEFLFQKLPLLCCLPQDCLPLWSASIADKCKNYKKEVSKYWWNISESTGSSFQEEPAFFPLHLLRMFVCDKDLGFNMNLLLQLRRLSGWVWGGLTGSGRWANLVRRVNNSLWFAASSIGVSFFVSVPTVGSTL